MLTRARHALGAALFLAGVAGAAGDRALSDAQVRKILIEESRAAYDGSCPCPYDTDRAGRRCGKRSAYLRPGGAMPLCYDRDVTKEMIEAYRKRASAD
jgi:hypothetical protein